MNVNPWTGRRTNAIKTVNVKQHLEKMLTPSLRSKHFAELINRRFIEFNFLTPKDIPAAAEIDLKDIWGKGLAKTEDQITSCIKNFPRGNIGAKINGELVGSIYAVLLQSQSVLDIPSTHQDLT